MFGLFKKTIKYGDVPVGTIFQDKYKDRASIFIKGVDTSILIDTTEDDMYDIIGVDITIDDEYKVSYPCEDICERYTA